MATKTYLVKEACYVGDVYYKPGQTFDYDFGDLGKYPKDYEDENLAGKPRTVGDHLQEVKIGTAKGDEAIAAVAREQALIVPEGHIGTAAAPNSGMTPEQNAGLQALGSDAHLTPEEVSQADAPTIKPV